MYVLLEISLGSPTALPPPLSLTMKSIFYKNWMKKFFFPFLFVFYMYSPTHASPPPPPKKLHNEEDFFRKRNSNEF